MLVAEADRRRQLEGLSNEDFAHALGVSGALWSQTKRGKKRLYRKLARAITQRYQDLEPLARAEGGQYFLGS